MVRGGLMEKNISGIMVYYYAVCKRKLWYFYHNINMEQNNDNVAIGKIIDETSYSRDEKHINIYNVINIDFIKNKGVLHEVKKSRKIEEASILQVKYYLYYLSKRGVNVKAQIDYPMLKQNIEVELTEEDVTYLDNILEDINKIVSDKIPPNEAKQSICKKCAFFDLCYI